MITVLFLCGVTLANAVMPYAVGLSLARPITDDDSSLHSPFSSAFLGTDFVFNDAVLSAPWSVMHDALIENFGQSAYAESAVGAESFVRRFSLPARGINWGVLHGHNGVDVAGACGSGIYAVAAGQVTDVRNGWEGGYGNYLDIRHTEVVTRYAHAETVLVKVGQMVAGGDMVARMGSTGNSTGCHVHFEVLGPASVLNPFAAR